MRLRLAAAFVALASVGAAGCGTAPSTVSARASWSPASTPDATVGFVYVELAADRDDTLTGAAVSADVAGSITLVTGAGLGGVGGHQGHLDGDGAPKHNHRATVPLSAGMVTRLQADGPYLRLERITRPLRAGGRFRVRLVFAKGAPLDIDVAIDDGPTAG